MRFTKLTAHLWLYTAKLAKTISMLDFRYLANLKTSL